MKTLVQTTLILSFSLLTLAACASRPEQELQAAQQAMKDADSERAAEFAKPEYDEAAQFWKEAEAKLAAEAFGEARQLLIKARVRFSRAYDLAKSARSRILREAEGVHEAAQLRFKSLQENLGSMRLSVSRRKSLEDAFAEIEKGLGLAKGELEKGNYTAARDEAQATMQKIRDAEEQLRR